MKSIHIPTNDTSSANPQSLKEIMEAAGLPPKTVIATARKYAPSFDKVMLSKCMNPQKYGVVIHPIILSAVKSKVKFDDDRTERQSSRSEKTLNQCERILRHFRDYGSITSLEAMKEYGIMRLASRVSDLKRRGYKIEVVTERGKNRYGESTSYARYFLREHKQEGNHV